MADTDRARHTTHPYTRFGRYILYVSCNPQSLQRDLRALHSRAQVVGCSYEVRRFAFFDHFPHTTHEECAVFLRKVRGFATPPA